MIAVVMVYAAAVSALLFGAALALEFFARAVGVPTRVVWAIAMVSSMCLSVAAIVRSVSTSPSAPASSDRSVHTRADPATSVQQPKVRWFLAQDNTADPRWLTLERGVLAQLERAATIDTRRLTRFDIPLAALWALTSLLCFVQFAVGVGRVWQAGRVLTRGIVGSERVLVSHDLGPALLGVVRPRVVVPEWVLSLPHDEQRLIIAHENSHRAAFDPALALAAALVVALQPWNVALWAVLARLRLAIEADCDRRVLRDDPSGHAAHRYGELLLSVYQRAGNGIAPTLAFVERRSSLETRILRLTRVRPRAASLSGVAAIAVSALAIVTACALPRPAGRVAPTAAADRASTSRPEWQASISFSRSNPGSIVAVAEASSRELHLAKMPPVAAISHDERHDSSVRVTATPIEPTAPVIRRHDLCGFGSRSHEPCSLDGDIVVRAVDDRHVIIGVVEGAARSVNNPVDHLFLVTAYQPLAGIQSRVFLASHVEYSGGTLRVSDPRGQAETLAFAVGRDTLDHARDARPARRFTNLSISQYVGTSLTLAMIPLLTPAPSCQPADHLCYSIDQITVGFP